MDTEAAVKVVLPTENEKFVDLSVAATPPAKARVAVEKTSAYDFIVKLGSELSGGKYELPPFPETAMKVRDAINRDDVTSEKIARIVVAEPALATRLLRIANSAMMGGVAFPVSDLTSAISRLGFDMVRNAAVSLVLDSAFPVPDRRVLRDKIAAARKRGATVCSLAFILAKRAKCKFADAAMLSGLVHNIGQFYMLSRADEFPELFIDEENIDQLLEGWHSGVGKSIVESWGFSASICEAIGDQEALDRSHFGGADLTDVLIVAKIISALDKEAPDSWPDFSRIPSCKYLQINSESIQELLADCAAEIRSLESALN